MLLLGQNVIMGLLFHKDIFKIHGNDQRWIFVVLSHPMRKITAIKNPSYFGPWSNKSRYYISNYRDLRQLFLNSRIFLENYAISCEGKWVVQVSTKTDSWAFQLPTVECKELRARVQYTFTVYYIAILILWQLFLLGILVCIRTNDKILSLQLLRKFINLNRNSYKRKTSKQYLTLMMCLECKSSPRLICTTRWKWLESRIVRL